MGAWRHFESDIKDLAEHLGYGAVRTPPSGDEGVDVLARKGNRIVAIQCKLYGSTRVNSDAIQKLLASKVIHNASDFICITSGKFTKAALELARRTGVLAIDGDALRRLCIEEAFCPRAITVLRGAGQEWSLVGEQISVGRADDGDVVVTNMAVSRKHGVFHRVGLRLYFRDLGSTYGTLINGQRIAPNQAFAVKHGDTICLAVEEFSLCWSS